MSIATTITTLQAKHAGITGVKTAPADFPAGINSADLPMILTFPAEADWSLQSMDGSLIRQDRTYRILCYVEALGNATVDERVDAAIPILQALGTSYLTDQTIAADSTIEQVQMPVTDTGIITLMFGDNAYLGFEMRVKITEKWIA